MPHHIRFLFWTIVSLAGLALASTPSVRAQSYVVVTGFDSDNVVRFDIETGEASEVLAFPDMTRPRGIAIDSAGNLFIGLRGGTQNIKRLTPTGVLHDFTQSIQGFGFGLLAFNTDGTLIAGGDISNTSSVFRYDGTSGKLLETFKMASNRNVIGLAVHDNVAYSVDYFDGGIARYDLSTSPTTGRMLVPENSGLQRVIGMAVGHNGNLFVAESSADGCVVEIEIGSGRIIGDFIPTADLDGLPPVGICYDDVLKSYFITAGPTIHRLDSTGRSISKFTSSLLQVPYGIVVAHENSQCVDWPGYQ